MKQTDRIMRHLTDYESITSAEAMNEYGIMRLASRIHDLKRRGVAIKKVMVTARNRYNEKISFARYSLERDENGDRITYSAYPNGGAESGTRTFY